MYGLQEKDEGTMAKFEDTQQHTSDPAKSLSPLSQVPTASFVVPRS